MNKLLQYMMDASNLDHRILPGLQKMQKGGTKLTMPVATLTDNPQQSSNLSISTGVKSGTYRPTSKVVTQADIKKQEAAARLKEEQDRKEAFAAAAKRDRENQAYFSQDNRTAGERENDRLRAIDAQMEQARSNSPFAQTLGSFTASGYNPAAGRIAAENIGNMTSMMGATRLASTIKDPKNNPYGIGRDKGWFDNTLGTLGLVGDALDVGVVTAPILKQSGRTIGKAYNKVATGESALPVAWKSPAVGLSQEASDAMFKGIANTTKLTDADRALLLEYQYDSKPFTGRWGTVDQSKKDALNNLIKNNNLNFTNDAILTRKFNPTNKSLGAEFVDGTLNLGDRPSSFSAGVGMPGYGSGAVDRLVVPNRYSKQMGNSLLANEYNKVSDGTFDLLSGDVKNFAAARGIALDDLLNAEREVIGTGLNFKRIGKVKNDIGGYDHVVRPKFQGGGGFNARPTLKQIMQMPDKRYTPAPGVMNTKAALAAAAMMSGPFSFIPGIAGATYDIGTAARYAMDGQWGNVKEDLISAGLNAIPTAGVYAALAGMGKLQKAARARAAIRSAKAGDTAKDFYGSSTIRNNITGLVQEFDKSGKQISSMRPRSAAEVKAYNKNLQNQYRTGYTPEGPAELMPFKSPDFAGGGMIVDPMGQWAHPGKNTRIPGSDITMQGVPYPVYGVGSNGQEQIMQPGQDYQFGNSEFVDEYPMMQIGGTMLNDKSNNMYFQDGSNLDMYGKGGQMIRRADGSYSKRGLWDNIRANKGSGKKPTKQMLEQEKKIKSKKYADGGTNNPGFEALPEYVQAKILSNMGYGGMTYSFMQEGGEEGEEAYIPQSIEELMSPTRRGVGNFGIGFNNDKFATNYNYTGANNFKEGTHALNVSLPAFMKTGSLDLSGTYSPGKSYGANVMGTAPADYIKKGAMMNFSGGFEKDTTPMMKNIAPSYNIGAGFNIPTKAGNFKVNASYRKERGGQTNYPYMDEGGEPNGGMALGQMSAVADKMSKLRQFISPEQNLDPWIASKLAVMDHSADAISDYMMYNPEAQGGEEMEEEGYEQEEMPEMGKGGYTVTRSSDRKGKTHKVTGPDGTVKYFGDSKLGQHPKDPERKKAFYARHKKNLDGNPYFRAFARATWANGGEIDMMREGGTNNPGFNALPEYVQSKILSNMAKGGSTFSGNAWYGEGGTNNAGFRALPEFVQNQILSNMAYGGIHINPANKGKFTASAKKAGMGVQEFASQVLANKEDYSSTQVKRANFARNAAGWNKANGGLTTGSEMEVTPEEAEMLRQQGYQFEIL